MFAYPTGKTDFASVVISDTTGKKRWDSPTGGLDSTAIGDWRTNGSVYIIDKGYSIGYIHQGFKKLQIISADETVYKIRYADLNGNNEQNIELEKDSAYNFIFLALKALI